MKKNLFTHVLLCGATVGLAQNASLPVDEHGYKK